MSLTGKLKYLRYFPYSEARGRSVFTCRICRLEACTSQSIQHGDSYCLQLKREYDRPVRSPDNAVFEIIEKPVFGSVRTFVTFILRYLMILHRQSDRSDWLLTDEASSWSGTPVERGWRYLRVALERHDNVDIDNAYTKVSLETILTYDRETPRPQWLIQSLEVGQPSHFSLFSPISF